MRSSIILLVLLSITIAVCLCEVTLPSFFGDGMVLQRNTVQCVKGKSEPNSIISLSFKKERKIARANASGDFEVCFKTGRESAIGSTLTLVESKPDRTIISATALNNILCGDVFWFSGQSNVQFTTSMGFNASQEIASANYANVKFWTGKINYSSVPLDKALHELDNGWNSATPDVIGGKNWTHTSALGYFFGRNLYFALDQAVPIGIVSTSYSGVPIQSLSSSEALSKCPKGPNQTVGQKQPSAVYNAMIHPLLSMKVKALVFWQGEGDLYNQTVYKCQLESLINDYRLKIKDRTMPFFNIHLNGYDLKSAGNQLFADIRIIQDSIDIRDTHKVPTLDKGDRQTDLSSKTGDELAQLKALYLAFGIHPRDKQSVAKRLLDTVLAKLYRKRINVSYPELSRVAVSKRYQVTTLSVTLKNSKGLIFSPTSDCYLCCGQSGYGNSFKLKLQNGTLIEPDTITVRPTGVDLSVRQDPSDILEVQYAYDNYPQCLIYNSANLPLVQFKKLI